VLADYGDILVHVFSAKAREYYDLERLWRAAKNVAIPADETAVSPAGASAEDSAQAPDA
jgi:hypothetical protein